MILEAYIVEEKGLRELITRQLKQHRYLDFPVIIFLATNKANRVAGAVNVLIISDKSSKCLLNDAKVADNSDRQTK